MLKNKLTLLLLVCATFSLQAQVDSTNVIDVEKKLISIEQQSSVLSKRVAQLQNQVLSLEQQNKNFQKSLLAKQQTIDSLTQIVSINSENIKNTAESLGVQIKNTDTKVSENTNSLKSTTIWGIIGIVFVLLASIVIAFLLHKKGQKSSDDKIAVLKKQADELNEKVVNQLTGELEEIKNIKISPTTSNGNAEPDHSLVKTLADRITFMEMTLYRMDKSVKGYKQLTKSISQMKDNLLANGYELVDMLGKDYDDGMKVTANFIEDENIESGKQIITGIVKPQINYKGVMIQSAQITVSQN